MLEDIRFLADDRLGGRMTGTPGGDSAAAYIARRFGQVGLQASARGWFQPFQVAKDAPAAQRALAAGATAANVIGILPGADPARRNETIVVGAHFDHLGMGGFGALDPDSTGRVHNGADDNASGTAALIDIAARLAAAPPARTVVFIAFSGEELGLLGSAHYVKAPLYPLPNTVAMVNLDMVGRLRNDRLIVYGTGTAREFPALLDSLNWYGGFDLRQQPEGYGPSDQTSFYAAKIPVLHLFTDLHEDYHRATDDWDKINVVGLERVSRFTAAIVNALANRPGSLTYVEFAPPPPVAPAPAGSGASLGTVPDMAAGDVGGVRLTGVRKDGPAERAGLREGDVITRIGEFPIPDLAAMAVALQSSEAGQEVDIVVLRDGAELILKATLGPPRGR